MKNTTYNTKYKYIIHSFFVENMNKHFTADEIYIKLKEKGIPVGKSTIYRQLEKLENEGEIIRYVISEGASCCYEYLDKNAHCDRHFHLKCSECKELFHVDCKFIDKMNTHIISHHNFEIDYTKTVFYGICEECAKRIVKGDL